MKSLLFEAAAPMVLLYPSLGQYFALAGVGFHYGIALFQNIDFVSWWGPFYILFAFEDTAVTDNIPAMVIGSFEAAPVATMLMLGYLLLHVLAMPFAVYSGLEILPFSSFHMFSEPKNLWDPSKNNSWWLSTKEHATGTLKNYAFPFCRKQHVAVEELGMLPFKYLFVGTSQGKELQFGNVRVGAKLEDLVKKMRQEWRRGPHCYLDSESVERALDLLEATKAEFAQAEKLVQEEPVHGASAEKVPKLQRPDVAGSVCPMKPAGPRAAATAVIM